MDHKCPSGDWRLGNGLVSAALTSPPWVTLGQVARLQPHPEEHLPTPPTAFQQGRFNISEEIVSIPNIEDIYNSESEVSFQIC